MGNGGTSSRKVGSRRGEGGGGIIREREEEEEEERRTKKKRRREWRRRIPKAQPQGSKSQIQSFEHQSLTGTEADDSRRLLRLRGRLIWKRSRMDM